jgi:hypothetical protein
MRDGSWTGRRVHARLLVQDHGDRVLVLPKPDGTGSHLPGGPLAQYSSLVEAARRGGEHQLGGIVTVGVPLSATLSERDGLVLVFSGDAFETTVPTFADPRDLNAGTADAMKSRTDGRVRYREALWWLPGPRVGYGNRLAPSLGELMSDWVDADIATWALGVALGIFPTTTTFTQVRGIVGGLGHPFTDVTLTLDRILRALAGVGVLDDDGSGAEYRWSSVVELVS